MTVVLRPATANDRDLLFHWVNQPDSLAGKLLTSGPISRAEHERWFAARLADPGTRLWIIESDGKAVGQLRLMVTNGAYEVDIYIEQDERRAGLARQALTSGIQALQRDAPAAKTTRARVKRDNVASQRLFERAGFALTAHHGDHLIYELKPS